jgi:signal transduction histidine kinase
MRSLIFDLRPSVLEKEGLVAALRARLEAVESRAGLAVELCADGVGPLPPPVEGGLYGIAQEALNNALKHSRARAVTIRITREDGRVVMEVVDDGAGFDPVAVQDHRGLGIKGMEERAAALGGQLCMESVPGEGTTVRVEVNL